MTALAGGTRYDVGEQGVNGVDDTGDMEAVEEGNEEQDVRGADMQDDDTNVDEEAAAIGSRAWLLLRVGRECASFKERIREGHGVYPYRDCPFALRPLAEVRLCIKCAQGRIL